MAAAFAGWAAMDSMRIQAGLETSWVGLKERISFYSWHVWFIVLAVTLLRRHLAAARPDRVAARGVAGATSSRTAL